MREVPDERARVVHRQIREVLTSTLARDPKGTLIRDAVGDALFERLNLRGSAIEVGRHITTTLLREHGQQGVRALANVLDEIADDEIDEMKKISIHRLAVRIPEYYSRSVSRTLTDIYDSVQGIELSLPLTVLEQATFHHPQKLIEYAVTLVAAMRRRQESRSWHMSPRCMTKEHSFARSVDVYEFVKHSQDQHVALVGAQDTGKSYFLERLIGEQAKAAVRDPKQSLPFLLHLGLFDTVKDGGLDPGEWVIQQWTDRYPYMPSLRDLLAHRTVCFILDDLDMLARDPDETWETCLCPWQRWIASLSRHHRVVVAGRPGPAMNQLKTSHVAWRFLHMQPCPLNKVRANYEKSGWDLLGGSGEDIERVTIGWGVSMTPFELEALGRCLKDGGHAPRNRAELLDGYTTDVLRDFGLENPQLWMTRMAEFAFGMWDRTWMTKEDIESMIDWGGELDTFCKTSERLGLIHSRMRPGDDVGFRHRTMQEYFSAFHLAKTMDVDPLRLDLDAVVEENDGTTLFVAPYALRVAQLAVERTSKVELIEAVADVHPILAAEIIRSSSVSCPQPVQERIMASLAGLSRDPYIDSRLRRAAHRALDASEA